MLKLQKWGNSAAVRLPAEILKQLDMKIGDTLETEIRDNELVVRAVKRPRYRLAELLAQMQQEQESTTPAVQAASTTDTRTAHQDDSPSGSHHAASASHDGGSSSSCDSDSGSSGCD